jgi:hypothetical protein
VGGTSVIRGGWIARSAFALVAIFVWCGGVHRAAGQEAKAPFHALAFYTDNGEPDHIAFANQAIAFYSDLSKKQNFEFSATTKWDELNAARLKDVQVVVWLNDFPHNAAQRAAFEEYMTHGGAWLGYHV